MNKNNGRLLSIDATRGFDMLFIMGMSGVIGAICELFPGGADCWLANQMYHVDWHGFRHHDTIFALFLFISGMTYPFSLEKKRNNGKSNAAITLDIIKRGLILFGLGLIYGGILDFNFSTCRIPSVLGRIGFAWMFAALIYTFTGSKVQWSIAGSILIGYYLLLRFCIAPDAPAGADHFSLEGNIVSYFDRLIMPNHILSKGVYDPEGILSTIPAIVTALLGIFTGRYVKESDDSGNSKTIKMLAAAANGSNRNNMESMVPCQQETVDKHVRPGSRSLVCRYLRIVLLPHRCERMAERSCLLPGSGNELNYHLYGNENSKFPVNLEVLPWRSGKRSAR